MLLHCVAFSSLFSQNGTRLFSQQGTNVQLLSQIFTWLGVQLWSNSGQDVLDLSECDWSVVLCFGGVIFLVTDIVCMFMFIVCMGYDPHIIHIIVDVMQIWM